MDNKGFQYIGTGMTILMILLWVNDHLVLFQTCDVSLMEVPYCTRPLSRFRRFTVRSRGPARHMLLHA